MPAEMVFQWRYGTDVSRRRVLVLGRNIDRYFHQWCDKQDVVLVQARLPKYNEKFAVLNRWQLPLIFSIIAIINHMIIVYNQHAIVYFIFLWIFICSILLLIPILLSGSLSFSSPDSPFKPSFFFQVPNDHFPTKRCTKNVTPLPHHFQDMWFPEVKVSIQWEKLDNWYGPLDFLCSLITKNNCDFNRWFSKEREG